MIHPQKNSCIQRKNEEKSHRSCCADGQLVWHACSYFYVSFPSHQKVENDSFRPVSFFLNIPRIVALKAELKSTNRILMYISGLSRYLTMWCNPMCSELSTYLLVQYPNCKGLKKASVIDVRYVQM